MRLQSKIKIICVFTVLVLCIIPTACSNNNVETNVSLDDMAKSIKIAGNMEVSTPSEEFLQGLQIDKNAYKEAVYYTAIDTLNSDELLLFNATDEENAKNIKDKLKEHLKALDEKWIVTGGDQYNKVRDAVIETRGQYVLFAVSKDAKAVKVKFSESF